MSNRNIRGVSPVIAVVLMVAVTVVLSAAVGAFVFNLGQSVNQEGSQTIGVQGETNGTHIVFHVITGEADRIRLLVDGSEVSNETDIGPGDSISTSIVTNTSDVTVISISDGQSTVVSTTNPLAERSGGSGSSLIAHWKLDDGSGTVATDSINSNDGDLINGTSWTSSSKVGPYALSTDGTNDYVNATDLRPDSFTLSLWMKSSSTGNLIDHAPNPDGTGVYGWRIQLRDTGKVRTRIASGGTWTGTAYSTTLVNDSTWHHIAATFNGSTVVTYVDGEPEGSDSATVSYTKTREVYLGATTYKQSVTGFYKGKLDDARIYNRALSSSEVQDLYNATK